jgi:hypothetical protein
MKLSLLQLFCYLLQRSHTSHSHLHLTSWHQHHPHHLAGSNSFFPMVSLVSLYPVVQIWLLFPHNPLLITNSPPWSSLNMKLVTPSLLPISNPSQSPISCFFNILYSHQNTSWVCAPTHTWESIIQDKWFAQGDPLGPLFSALTLSILLKQINSLLLECSEFRCLNNQQPNDDTLGSQTHTASTIINDTSTALPYADIAVFLYKFAKLGKPLGIKLLSSPKLTSSHPLLDPPLPLYIPIKSTWYTTHY